MYYSKIKLDIIYDCFVGINGGNRKSVGIFIDMENKSPTAVQRKYLRHDLN